MASNGGEKALVDGGRIPDQSDAVGGSVDADNEGNNNPRSGDDNNERSCWNSSMGIHHFELTATPDKRPPNTTPLSR